MTKIPTDEPDLADYGSCWRVGHDGLLCLAATTAPEFEQLPDPKSWLSPSLHNEFRQLTHEGRRREWIITRWMLFCQLQTAQIFFSDEGVERLDGQPQTLPMAASGKGGVRLQGRLPVVHVATLGEGVERLHLEKGGNGQPLLPKAPDWGVSLSHCPGFAAVLLAPGRVGVDVERYRPQVHRIVDRYLQDAEKVLLGADTGARTLGWAVKEAVFKWMGGGGIAFREAIQIESIHPERSLLRVRVQRTGEPDARVIDVHYDQQPEVERVCAWVVEGTSLPLNPISH